ncbi:MAG: hypothetical protein PHO76_04685 [Methylotenera sp.]|nr:hypothetical protein [Methylotenera sp.]MDD4925897.1 hypothetical protein [Methylotenera sp.]
MLKTTFDDKMLECIIDASMIYMCACPAQVAREILDMRQLYNYQQNCINSGPLNIEVHQVIAEAVRSNHFTMEIALDKILTIENWDRETLEMPEGLRILRDSILSNL